MHVEFYQVLFWRLLRWSCDFCLFLLMWLMQCITLSDLYMLNHPCDPRTTPTWPWWTHGFFLLYCWIQFDTLAFSYGKRVTLGPCLLQILVKEVVLGWCGQGRTWLCYCAWTWCWFVSFGCPYSQSGMRWTKPSGSSFFTNCCLQTLQLSLAHLSWIMKCVF